MNRRTKKNAMRTRISAASPVSVQRSSGSSARARGGRSTSERPPRTVVRLPASIARAASGGRAGEGLPVALQALHLGLRRSVVRVGERRVLQLRGDLLTAAERVVEPALHERGLGLLHPRLAHVLPDEQERHGGDRVRGLALGVDRAEAQVGRRARVRAGGRRRLEGRLDVLAVGVLDRRGRELVLQRVRLLDVYDRTLGLLHAAGDAVIALRAGAGRPLDLLVDARAALPRGRVVGEELREVLRRARRVGAVADRDAVARQLDAGVLARDFGVVPLLDLAEEDVSDGLAVELEALLDAVDVVRDGHRAEHRRHVDGVAALLLGRRDLVVLHRRVGGPEVHGAGAELRDAAAGADGLVVDRRAVRLLEAGGPLLVDRRRERGAGTIDRAAGLGRAARAGARAARATGARVAVVAAAGGRGERQHGAATQGQQVVRPHKGLLGGVRFVMQAAQAAAKAGAPTACYASRPGM